MKALKVAEPYYDASKVKEAASGHWLEIFAYLAYDQLDEALRKPGSHVTCPIHSTSSKKGRGDGFRFFKKDVVDTGGGVCNTCGTFNNGLDLLIWLKGWDFRETLSRVAEFLNVEPEIKQNNERSQRSAPVSGSSSSKVRTQPETRAVVPLNQPTPEKMEEIKLLQEKMAQQVGWSSSNAHKSIERVWSESISLDGGLPGPLLRYLKHRGVLLRRDMFTIGDNVRFHQALPYHEDDDDGNTIVVGKFPAMITAIRGLDGDIITLHRTYLTTRGKKAKVECHRKMMSVPDDKCVVGAAIQLGGLPKDGVIGVAEGLETALSPMRVYGIPTWSCVSTAIMKGFIPPAGVHTVIGWEDKDRSLAGQTAMEALKQRLEQQNIRFIRMAIRRPIPKGKKSVDWNDVLVNEGVIGFPAWNNLNHVVSGGASWVS